MSFLFYFIALNTLLTLIYTFVRLKRRESVGVALYFFFLPYLGMVMYFLPLVVKKFKNDQDFSDTGLVLRAAQVELMPEAPGLKEELNVAPIEDALIAGEAHEKRALLLRELKKDLRENYKILLKARDDDDSETAHYAAAAKMEIYRILQQHRLDSRRDYEEKPDDPEAFHRACAALSEIFYSDVFSEREVHSYKKHYVELVGHRLFTYPNDVELHEFEEYINCLADLGEYEDVRRIWEDNRYGMKSEKIYMRLLKMFYENEDFEKFKQCFNEMCQNKQIRLSADGLAKLRYWAKRTAQQQGS